MSPILCHMLRQELRGQQESFCDYKKVAMSKFNVQCNDLRSTLGKPLYLSLFLGLEIIHLQYST